MGVAFRELPGGAPGGDYLSRAIVHCREAPITDAAFMGLTSRRRITIGGTIAHRRCGAQPNGTPRPGGPSARWKAAHGGPAAARPSMERTGSGTIVGWW